MGLILDAVGNILFCWTTPAKLTIVDKRLGLLNWGLKAGIISAVIANCIVNEIYQTKEIPRGSPTFWFDSAGLQEAQNGTAPYCNNKDYDYIDFAGSNYWNDENVTCGVYDYGEILTKAPKYANVATFIKESHTKRIDCAGGNACNQITGGGRTTELAKLPYTKADGTAGFTCQCSKLRDNFVLGVEAMRLTVQHAFTTTGEYFDGMRGSSTNTKADNERNSKKIRTCVRNQNQDDKCIGLGGIDESDFGDCCAAVRQPGEDLAFYIREWLGFAGVQVDERTNGDNIPASKIGGVHPFIRASGVQIQVTMKYYGDASQEEIACIVDVSYTTGWTSFGRDNIYVSYSPFGPAEFYDLYKRGIRFLFEAKGEVTTFDPYVFWRALIASLVFLAAVDQIVSFVATTLLPQSKTYSAAKNEVLQMDETLAKFGITAALACTSFRQWDSHEGEGEHEERTLDEEELISIYTAQDCLDRKTARKFAMIILKAQRKKNKLPEDAPAAITCKDLVDLMSTGLVSLDGLQEYVEKTQAASAKVQDANEEDGAGTAA